MQTTLHKAIIAIVVCFSAGTLINMLGRMMEADEGTTDVIGLLVAPFIVWEAAKYLFPENFGNDT